MDRSEARQVVSDLVHAAKQEIKQRKYAGLPRADVTLSPFEVEALETVLGDSRYLADITS